MFQLTVALTYKIFLEKTEFFVDLSKKLYVKVCLNHKEHSWKVGQERGSKE